MKAGLDKLRQLAEKEKNAELGTEPARIDKQHQLGKLTARERVELLLDPGSFNEMDKFVVHRCTEFGMGDKKYLGDGVITGYGQIAGRPVYVYSQDFTIFGGSLSNSHAQKICKVMDLALKTGTPLIGINDSGGARIQEGVDSLAGYAEIFWRNTQISGVVPQISVILGPCAGGAVYSPAITDFVFMAEGTSHLFITGPDVIKAVTHEIVDKESLGGAEVHTEKTGVAHFVAPHEPACLNKVRKLFSYFPLNNLDSPPKIKTNDPLNRSCMEIANIIPDSPNKPYDMRKVIADTIDTDTFMEVQEQYAKNIIVGFGRLAGRVIGLVGNQPAHLAGCVDINAATKAARFIRFCDSFNIPIITFVDVPGFLPGVSQEHSGIIKHGAKLLYAYSEATVPKIAVITRKAYGGGYIVMSSKHLRSDYNFAYPSAEIAVMGSEGAVNVLFRRELSKAENEGRLQEVRTDLLNNYQDTFANPYQAAEFGYIDEIIVPEETRRKLISSLQMIEGKRIQTPSKKHGNIPL